MRKAARIGRPRQKCTNPAKTLTIGSTSAGKSTLRIKLPPAISEFDDSSSDEENQVHGRRPQNRNSENGSMPALRAPGMTVVKTNV